jgi:hypothetical protein
MNSLLALLRTARERCRIPLPVPIPVPVRRPRVLGALFAATLATAMFGAQASHAATTKSQVDGRLVDVQVLVDGWPTPLFDRPGAWDRSYFQAFQGRNYSLVVTNQTNQRVGVLLAVDGLNVVNGQRTSLSSHESMYVLDPYESTTIQGWRTSLNDVRRFVFVDEQRSYASRTDQANGDMGWIRVLSFREQTPVVFRDRPKVRGQQPNELQGRGESAPAPSMGGDLRAQKPGMLNQAPQSESVPGTGWGDRSFDPVTRTQFLAAASPTDRIVLRYEYESGLRALGIVPRQRRVFERERGELGFAQPPRR